MNAAVPVDNFSDLEPEIREAIIRKARERPYAGTLPLRLQAELARLRNNCRGEVHVLTARGDAASVLVIPDVTHTGDSPGDGWQPLTEPHLLLLQGRDLN